MVSSATEYIKAGFTEQEAENLAVVSSMYQNVADDAISAAEASSFIIAQLSAFNMEASEAESVIDMVNEVSNRFAVSSSDISSSLGIMSSALATGNNSLEQSIALLTAGTEITRSASKTARGNLSLST